MGIETKFVSRLKNEENFSYDELTPTILDKYKIIIHQFCTIFQYDKNFIKIL